MGNRHSRNYSLHIAYYLYIYITSYYLKKLYVGFVFASLFYLYNLTIVKYSLAYNNIVVNRRFKSLLQETLKTTFFETTTEGGLDFGFWIYDFRFKDIISEIINLKSKIRRVPMNFKET